MEWFDNCWSVYSNLVLTLGINALLALSIYLTLSCGLLAMANAAFMGIGAYTSALLTMNAEMPFSVALLGGMAAPAVVAVVIGRPTLRLSGVYLAMATLGFGEVVRVLILNTENWTGGALGLNGIPQLTEWWHVAVAVLATLFVLARMRRSKVGRAFEAIKEDETAAGLMGINVAGAKLLAFTLGAAIAGLAGALNAHLTFFIGPNEFGFDRGVEILTMTIGRHQRPDGPGARQPDPVIAAGVVACVQGFPPGRQRRDPDGDCAVPAQGHLGSGAFRALVRHQARRHHARHGRHPGCFQ